MSEIGSYPSIYAMGHRAIRDIFDSPVVVEEKVDGSQFSMMKKDGQVFLRSKGAVLYTENPEKMFKLAIETAQSLDLHDGWVYRGEYLSKPKHNTLNYGRVPAKNVILFDVMTAPETYLTYVEKAEEAARLGLEVVPLLFEGKTDGFEQMMEWLNRESILGNSKIEGFVVKNYDKFTEDKKIYLGKYVSEAFKEKHSSEWKNANPGKGDVITQLGQRYKTEARWRKSVQHLRELGKLSESPVDIGPLLKEIQEDIKKEEIEEIKEMLFQYALPQILRAAVAGFPEWYKSELAQLSFVDKETVQEEVS